MQAGFTSINMIYFVISLKQAISQSFTYYSLFREDTLMIKADVSSGQEFLFVHKEAKTTYVPKFSKKL